MTLRFEDVARLPAPDDNAAIAIRRLEAGTVITSATGTFTIPHTVLVGHRFAVRDIPTGERLLSWGQTFGIATRSIVAGEYLVNADVLKELRRRSLAIDLPEAHNFQNDLAHYQFDPATFTPAEQIPRHTETRTFIGYPRDGGRGVGTRNTVILLGTSALSAGFVRRLETQLKPHLADYPNIDGIVAVAHTEGAHGEANNTAMILRALAGFVVHPNVAAVLLVDYGSEAINNTILREYLQNEGYPLDAVTHQFMSLSASFDDDLTRGEAIVREWLPAVNAAEHSPQPASELKIALQCGGSDAFSGVSGNPLAAWVAKEVIKYGGAANLAETDELIGAETYVLDKVRDAATAQKFLSFVERFKARVGWHGHSAEGNPSGGNKFRGLYNIYLKSLGAATKRHPDVRLDYVIDYGEPMQHPGYYFMDSPGNDLESVAGQVAAGCNMIFFVTGNGSITNFPFVPTVKFITTSERNDLLSGDMDINAGAYLDGTPLPELGASTLQYTLEVASGQRSVGEQAGHAQVQIWRDWQFNQPVPLEPLQNMTFSGEPIAIHADVPIPDVTIDMLKAGERIAREHVGLILPTSLCSGQIAQLCVNALNKNPRLQTDSLSRFVTLVHTEGCGNSVNPEFKETLLGYLAHPFVKHALLLEHGCEATHNDYFRESLADRNLSPEQFGWASIQLDGGIQRVVGKMTDWFASQIKEETTPTPFKTDLSAVQLGLITTGNISPELVTAYATLAQIVVSAGGTVVMHEQDPLLNTDYPEALGTETVTPSLGYGQLPRRGGFHIMAMPTRDWGEVLAGIGAAGVQVFLAHVDDKPMPGHPMIPTLQASSSPGADVDIDLSVSTDPVDTLLDQLAETLSRWYTPRSSQTQHISFQITRGLLGVSL